MAALNIIDVNFVPDTNRTTVRANTATRFEFVFDRDLLPTDSPVIRCHLHDPIFDLEYYPPDITVSPTPPATSTPVPAIAKNKYRSTIRIPEELAGAQIIMTFYMKLDPDSMEDYSVYGTTSIAVANVAPADPISKTIKITPNVGISRIENVYWGEDDNIQFGINSTKRTSTVHKNETAYLHIHTRGLWGKEIDVRIQSSGFLVNFPVKVKNNTCVFSVPMWHWITFFTPASTQLIGKAKKKAESSYLKSDTVPLDITTDRTIIPVTASVPASTGRDIMLPLGSNAECRVEFRPDTDYTGNFGFSWFRKGELNAYPGTKPNVANTHRTNAIKDINFPCNDQPFTETMGRHYDSASTALAGSPRTNGAVVQNGNNSSPNFDKDPIMVENHKLDYRKLLIPWLGNNDEYLVPVMTIRKGEKAELRLFIETKKEVDKIEFEFDNPKAINEGYLSIDTKEKTLVQPPAIPSYTPKPIRDVPKRLYSVYDYIIEINCLKEFSKELMLRAKVYRKSSSGKGEIILPDICGAIRLLPNDISHQRNIKVVFFNLKTNINGIEVNGLNKQLDGTFKEESNLRKFLNQAYINIIDLAIKDINLIDSSTNQTKTGYLNCCKSINNGQQTVLDYDKLDNLKTFLLNEMKSIYGTAYEGYNKIFFTEDFCVQGTSSSKGGVSMGEKFTICFHTSQAKDFFATHELGHALGLPHTFDGSTSRAKYVYQDGTTDNIMDYAHLVGVKLQSFFHWQWFAINRKLP
ncbi:hypothetical protein FACS1894177_00910 [Bacteroidia bacterium]|nr:hypothetical protein FACS1894177_00910 [Bacteroidia bacterium]